MLRTGNIKTTATKAKNYESKDFVIIFFNYTVTMTSQ